MLMGGLRKAGNEEGTFWQGVEGGMGCGTGLWWGSGRGYDAGVVGWDVCDKG